MMPYGYGPAGALCSQCGCSANRSFQQGFGAGPTWAGTFAPTYGFAGPGMGFGGPGMAFGGQGMGFGAPGFGGFGQPWAQYGSPNFGFAPNFNPVALGWGLGGLRRWGGSYSPQFLLTGLPTDDEITEMVYDAIDADPLIPYDADINVDTDAGTVTLSGTVPSKQIKHAAGDDAWWIPGVDDVRNDMQVVSRRTTHAEGEEARPARPTSLRTSERTTTTSRR